MKKIIIGLILILIIFLTGCSGLNEKESCYMICRNNYFNSLNNNCYEAFNTDDALECGLSYEDTFASKKQCFEICYRNTEVEQ